MTLLAPLVMLGWIPATLALFRFLPTRRALIAAFVAGWLFLPNAEFEIHGWPNYNKLAAICVVSLAAILIFDRRPLLRLRPAAVDAPTAFFCISPILSSLAAGLGMHEALSIFFWQSVAWGIPFLLGRAYLGDAAGLRTLAKGIVAGGSLYIPLCIFEFFAGPELHHALYGFYTRKPLQALRFGAWRPVVFLETGMMTAFWMAAASLAAAWLWRGKAFSNRAWAGRAALALTAITLLLRSVNGWCLLALGWALLWFGAHWRSRAPAIAIIAAIPIFIALRASGAWDGESAVHALAKINAVKAQSVEYRFLNENIIASNARRRPWLGLGRGKTAFYTRTMPEFAVPDSLWILTFGQFGIAGLVGLLTVILAPAALFLRAVDPSRWSDADFAPAAVLAIFLLLYMVDSIFNAMVNPVLMLGAGGVAQFSATLLRRSPR